MRLSKLPINKKWIVGTALAFFLFIGASGIFAGVETFLTFRELRSLHIQSAATHASRVLVIVRPVSFLTFHKIADLELWQKSLEITTQLPQLSEDIHTYISLAFHDDVKSEKNASASSVPQRIADAVNQIDPEFQTIAQLSSHAVIMPFFFRHFVQVNTANSVLVNKAAHQFHDLNEVTQHLLTGSHRYIILFQNSDELRPTGGFMGSYANVALTDGTLSDITIQDIYEPDGQFHGFMEAPPGVLEYLSSGHGMRLPDANWDPDFPSNAKTILNFFALGNEKNIDGVIALNLQVAQEMLRITGNIDMPDYHLTVTPENLADVARADRSEFFPGSQQKRNFLTALFTQLKLKMQQLTPSQQQALLSLILQQAQTKNLQFYSNDDTIEKIFLENHIAGQLSALAVPSAAVPAATIPPTTDQKPMASPIYFFSVEANVGINKVNRHIQRSVEITSTDPTSPNTFTISIHFKNEDPDLNYINYQRFFFQPDVQLKEILYDNSPIPPEKITTTHVTTTSQENFQQIGFLLPITAHAAHTLSLTLSASHPINNETPFIIQKQSGVPPTSYIIQVQNDTHPFLLDRDLVTTATIAP